MQKRDIARLLVKLDAGKLSELEVCKKYGVTKQDIRQWRAGTKNANVHPQAASAPSSVRDRFIDPHGTPKNENIGQYYARLFPELRETY